MSVINILRLPLRGYRYWSVLSRLGHEASERHGVSSWRMVKESLALRKLNELRWHEYIYYRLFDPEKPWERKTQYIGQSLMRRLWSALNPIEYRYIFKNKLVFHQVCDSVGLPVPLLIGVFDPDCGRTADGRPLRTRDDIAEFILGLEEPEIVIKPAEGAEGRMVRAFSGTEESGEPTLLELDGTPITARQLYDYMTDEQLIAQACSGGSDIRPVFLIERRLTPHPEMADLSPKTLCSFRVATLRDTGVEPHIIGATYKYQRTASGADNMHRGSMAISIDIDTGILGTGWTMLHEYYKGVFDSLPPVERLESDPVTDVQFKDRRIPMWDGVKDVALRAAETFPYVRAVGWDIAVTPDGPVILEGNWAWGEELTQGGGGRGLYHGDFKAVCERLRAEGKADKELV